MVVGCLPSRLLVNSEGEWLRQTEPGQVQEHSSRESVVGGIEGGANDLVVVTMDDVPVGIGRMRPVDDSVEGTPHSVSCAGGGRDQAYTASFDVTGRCEFSDH